MVPFGVAVPSGAECTVVDLASRHLPPSEARARAVSAPAHALHKIDSTLRGSWAHEIVGRQQAHAVRVVVAPAFPAAGRVCVDGVVYVDGVPVAEGAAATDARGPVRSSRPADYLCDAGASAVDAVTPSALAEWLETRGVRFAVCDAATDADLDVIARGVVRALRRRARGHGCGHRRSRRRRVAARRSSA